MVSTKRSEAISTTSTSTTTTFTDLKSEASLGVSKRCVPLPRPGELLIYDCRPPSSDHGSRSGFVAQEQGNNANNNCYAFGSLLNKTSPSSSSPPTPTPTFDTTFPGQSGQEGTFFLHCFLKELHLTRTTTLGSHTQTDNMDTHAHTNTCIQQLSKEARKETTLWSGRICQDKKYIQHVRCVRVPITEHNARRQTSASLCDPLCPQHVDVCLQGEGGVDMLESCKRNT